MKSRSEAVLGFISIYKCC